MWCPEIKMKRKKMDSSIIDILEHCHFVLNIPWTPTNMPKKLNTTKPYMYGMAEITATKYILLD